MKNYISSFMMILALLVFASSCIEEAEDFPGGTDGAQANPSGIEGIFDLVDIPSSTVSFDIDVINPSSVQVASVTIMKSYNGGEMIEHATVSTLPASVSVTPADVVAGIPGAPAVADLQLGDAFTLTLVANTNNGSFRSPNTIVIDATCSSALEGTYESVTTYSQHDFLPDYGSNTAIVEITKVSDGVYSIADVSGGLYGSGPYVDAYGTSDLTAEFKDVCGELTFSSLSDPWGPVTIAIVSDEQGVLTVTATAETYGESWVSVYTPQ